MYPDVLFLFGWWTHPYCYIPHEHTWKMLYQIQNVSHIIIFSFTKHNFIDIHDNAGLFDIDYLLNLPLIQILPQPIL